MKSAAITPQLAARRRAVHAACRELQMDEDTRRTMLKGVAGVDSTKKLSMEACAKVLNHLRRAGAGQQPPARAVGMHPGTPASAAAGSAELLGKVGALLADMQLPWSYGLAILRRVSQGQPTGGSVERFELASPEMLRGVISALTIEQQKRNLLASVREQLRQAGIADDQVSTRFPTIKRGWERSLPSLRRLQAALQHTGRA